MKAAVSREGLIAGLDRALKVISTRVPILNYARIEAIEGDRLRISATDQVTSIVVTLSEGVRVAEPGMVLLPVRDLLAGLRSSTSPSVGIVGTDGSVMVVAKGQARWNWTTPELNQFPRMEILDDAVVYMLDRHCLLTALRSVKSAAARGTFHPRLEQIGIRKGKVQASDGRRYHEAALPNADMIDVALPVRFVDEILPLLSKDASPTVELGTPDDTTISVRSGNVLMATRRSKQVFPDISHAYLIPAMANNIELKLARSDLLGAIYRLRVSADPTTKAIRLSVGETQYDSVDISTRQQGGDWAQERVVARWPGGARTMMFNHEHLSSLLNLFDEENLILKFGPDAKYNPSSVLIRQGDRIGVLQQVRVDWWRK